MYRIDEELLEYEHIHLLIYVYDILGTTNITIIISIDGETSYDKGNFNVNIQAKYIIDSIMNLAENNCKLHNIMGINGNKCLELIDNTAEKILEWVESLKIINHIGG